MNSLLVFIFFLGFCFPAIAGDVPAAHRLKETIKTLQPLVLHYGANTVHISEQDVLIVRGAFVSETAGGGDGYTTLVDEGKKWQLVRLDEGVGNETTQWTNPHAGEDSVTAVSFFITKNAGQLYLLKAHRNYQQSPTEAAPVEFTLYTLQKEHDFGIYYFRKVSGALSQKTYCNVDSAAYHELGIPLPDGEREYSCPKQ